MNNVKTLTLVRLFILECAAKNSSTHFIFHTAHTPRNLNINLTLLNPYNPPFFQDLTSLKNLFSTRLDLKNIFLYNVKPL